jgi:PIN domain nuclease of toxin-antitoxin system
MNVLLDTCALLALADGDLPKRASTALRQAPEAYVSSVTAWEVAIKVAGGKLRLLEAPSTWFQGVLERYGLREVPLDGRTACQAAGLPLIHRDPFDRVIVALAQARELPVLTSDDNIPKYDGVKAVW